MESYGDIQRQTRELEEIRNEMLLAKFDLVYENMKGEQLEALLQADRQDQQYLAQNEPFFAQCKKLMMETDKYLHKLHTMMTCGFAQDVYCAVQELERHRKKIRDEREEAHKIHLAELEKELSKQPHAQAIIVRQEKFDQLQKELEELEVQMALEQAEIDTITENEKQLVASYEPNIRELENDVANDEAEVERIKVQLGMVTEQTPETFAEQQPKVLPKIQASSERSVPVDTQQAKNGVPLYLKKMDIVDTVTEFVVNSEDGTEDSTTYPGQKRAIALAIASQSDQSECSGSQATAAAFSQNVPNESKSSGLAPHQSVKQMDHSHAQSVRSESLKRPDEPNLVGASNNNGFAVPLAPAPHAYKRKESGPEQASPAKKKHYEQRQLESRDSRKSPRESPRQSPKNEIGFTDNRQSDRSEPHSNLVKREYPTEQKSVIAKPVVQAPMGATPREVVSQLHSQHHDNGRSGHSKYSSAFQPIQTPSRYQTNDNRGGSSLSTSGQRGSKTPMEFSSAQAKTAPSGEETSKMSKQGGNEKFDKTNEQQDAFRSGRNHDDHSHYSRSTQNVGDDELFGLSNDESLSFSSFDFDPMASTIGQRIETKSDNSDDDRTFFGDLSFNGHQGDSNAEFDDFKLDAMENLTGFDD